jgi:predicted DCC family thiol-disulfide oxidoreductase YuxK
MKAIIFYDPQCGFCAWAVQLASRLDKKRVLGFAPSRGKTAEKELSEWRKIHQLVDSIVVKQDESYFIYSKAIFRIAYLLGLPWSLIGWLSLLPTPLLYPSDLIYRCFAHLRRNICAISPKPERGQRDERFLP